MKVPVKVTKTIEVYTIERLILSALYCDFSNVFFWIMGDGNASSFCKSFCVRYCESTQFSSIV